MLKNRLISAFILMPTIIAALFLLPPLGFAILILIVCMLAAWEWGQLSGFNSCYARIWLMLLYGLILIMMLFLLPEYYLNMNQPMVSILLWISLIWWIIALLLLIFYPNSAKIWRHSKILRVIFGLLIIIPFFWEVLALRIWHYNENRYTGALCLLYIMILVWSVDSSAYIFGKLFGKHKLAPKISPEKTWQGFIGGILTAVIVSWIYSVLAHINGAILSLLMCSVIIGLASVLGDLTESMFKRGAGIKDSSHIIPGHGGILDRIDSLTAAVPVFGHMLLLIFETI